MSWDYWKEAYYITLEKDLMFEESSSDQYLPPTLYPSEVTVSRIKGSAVWVIHACDTSTWKKDPSDLKNIHKHSNFKIA